MADYPVGISTMSYMFTHSARACLEHLADKGFRLFELVIFPPHVWPTTLDEATKREIAAFVADRGLAITSLCYPLLDNNINSPVPEVRRFTIDMYKRVIDLAGDWGVPRVLVLPGAVHPYFRPPFEWLMEWFTEGIRELSPHARGAGVQLLVENVQYTFLPTVADIARALDEIGDETIGMNYDVGNAVIAGGEPAEDLRLIMDRINLVHVADVNHPDEARKIPIGTGTIDYTAIAETYRAINYSGPSMLEVITDEDRDAKMVASGRALAKLGWAPLAR